MEIEQITIDNLRKVVDTVSPHETVALHVSTLTVLMTAYDEMERQRRYCPLCDALIQPDDKHYRYYGICEACVIHHHG